MELSDKNEFKRVLRSSISKEEREAKEQEKIREKKAFDNRPFIKFNGKIHYLIEFVDIAMACDKLIELAANCSEFLALGFDLEWPFSFQTGPGKVAVMQISPNLNTSYIFGFSEIEKLPMGVCVLLSHPKVRLTGVNIRNDVQKLGRDFQISFKDKMLENCIDCGVLANQVLPVRQRWSMEKLVGYLLKKKINKDKKVRMSRWHEVPLSTAQLKYAATDSYASLLLYETLKQKQIELESQNDN